MTPRTRAAWLAAAGAAIALAYANHFAGSFHFDDWHTVEQNLFLRDLRNAPRFFTDAHTFSSLPSNQSYRPLVTLTLAVDYAIAGGLRAPVFHAQSFLWFLLQCGLMYLLFRRALGRELPALFGAALYGLHPAVAETVNYVISRSDILSALGAVATVLLWAQGGRARRLHLYLIPAALGVLAKEQGAMAAPLLLLWIGLIEQRRSLGELLRPRALWEALRPALPAFAVSGGAAVLAMRMAPGWVSGGSSRWLYLATQPWVLLHYAAMFVLPVSLTADTDWTAVGSAADLRVLAGGLFVIAALAAAGWASRRDRTRPIAYGLLWFFAALIPTSSVVPLAEVMNDHRMYFPFVGLALAAACAGGLLADALSGGAIASGAAASASGLAASAPGAAASGSASAGGPAVPSRGARWITAAALLLLCAAGIGTHLRNRVWRSEETLWRDVTEKSPGNARGWMNYGLSLMSRGEYPGAEAAYSRALQLAPDYGYLHVNMGILQGALGRPALAEAHFRRGVALMPRVPALRYFFARWLGEVGRGAEAELLLREAIALSPAESDSRALLMKLLAGRQAWAELREAAVDALRIRRDDPVARQRLGEAERGLRSRGQGEGRGQGQGQVQGQGWDPLESTCRHASLSIL